MSKKIKKESLDHFASKYNVAVEYCESCECHTVYCPECYVNECGGLHSKNCGSVIFTQKMQDKLCEYLDG